MEEVFSEYPYPKKFSESCGSPKHFIETEWVCFNKVTAVSDLRPFESFLLGLQKFLHKFKIYLQEMNLLFLPFTLFFLPLFIFSFFLFGFL